MDFKNSPIVNKNGIITNCLMYMIIRLTTETTGNESIEPNKKSFTIMDSINRSLSKVEK